MSEYQNENQDAIDQHENKRNLDISLELLLERLPEIDDKDRRRKETMTRNDGRFVIDAVKIISSHQPCSAGFSPEHIKAIREIPAENLRSINDVVVVHKKFLTIIGGMVIAFFGGLGTVMATTVEWKKVAAWIWKHTFG